MVKQERDNDKAGPAWLFSESSGEFVVYNHWTHRLVMFDDYTHPTFGQESWVGGKVDPAQATFPYHYIPRYWVVAW